MRASFIAVGLILLNVVTSSGQGTLTFISGGTLRVGPLRLDEMPSEPTFRELTRHARLTLPATYFTGPIGGGSDGFRNFGRITPVLGFDSMLGAPGFESAEGIFLIGFPQAEDLAALRSSNLRTFHMPPLPPSNLSFVELPGGGLRRLLLAPENDVTPFVGDQVTTVPEPSAVALVALAGLGCWLLRRKN